MGQTGHMNLKKSQPQKIRVLIVDDHEFVRKGMAFVLSPFEDIDVVGTAPSGEEALRSCQELRPDVILMDMSLPGMDGAAAAGAIRARYPQVQVLALTSFHEVRPGAEIFKLSAKTGAGMDAWLDYLQARFAEKQG